MKKIGLNLLLFCCLLMCFSCEDHDDFFTYSSDKVEKKIIPNEWNIEEMDIWIIDDYQSNTAVDEFHFTNVGTMVFREDKTMDILYNDGQLVTDYITFSDLKAIEWDYSGGIIELGEGMTGNVMYVDKKEMLIHCPFTLNFYLTTRKRINQSVEFRFKLKKK